MSKENVKISNKVFIIFIIVITAVIAGLIFWMKQEKKPDTKILPKKAHIPAKPQPVIDYNKLEKDEKLKALMNKRKAKYGVEKGIDVIVKSDESLKIGDSTVSMQEVQEKIRLKEGDILEKDIESSAMVQKETPKIETEEFGIYVVQPGDNYWNMYFKLLKNYFDHKGITLSPLADEPDRRGFSSGVGKILKFSENMVYIYNIKERKLDVDLNLIFPLSKVVVYKMRDVFALLDQIDYKNVNHIQFDGETLWIPAEQ